MAIISVCCYGDDAVVGAVVGMCGGAVGIDVAGRERTSRARLKKAGRLLLNDENPTTTTGLGLRLVE